MKNKFISFCVLATCLLITSTTQAQVYATVAGYKDGATVKVSELLNDCSLLASDSTYKIISFDFSCIYKEQLNLLQSKDNKLTQDMKNLLNAKEHPAKIYIESITAIKDGEKKKLKGVNLVLVD
ncbi:MAG: hypothetical protein J0M08_07395 [Bacteroidetes bacterium]|nr:hypothetical protein [Bacteroidota bacterium]